jgi:hypothetical protein
MASIKLSDLVRNSIIGADLFNDSESFIRDLSDDEVNFQGGCGRNRPVKIGADTLPIIVIFSCISPRPVAF